MALRRWSRIPMRQILLQTLMFASTFSSTFMLYTGARIVTNKESPAVVVLSGSMEPAFRRGDLLFLTNPPAEQYINGDIVVYKVPAAHIPIVHGVIEARDVERWSSDDNEIDMEIGDMDSDLPYRSRKPFSQTNRRTIWNETAGDQLLLTKGDNNPIDDIVLYNGSDRLSRGHIIGKVRGFIPYIRYISIVLNDMYAVLKL